MKKKLLSLLLALSLLLSFASCVPQEMPTEPIETFVETVVPTQSPTVAPTQLPTEAPTEAETEPEPTEIPEDGWYYSAEEVGLYIHTYGKLPSNFITKDEARALGWTGGTVENYAYGHAIGGDRFYNREGLLPKAQGRLYYECDIDTHGSGSRGARRIVFSNDGLIFYTTDHYKSFTQLYGEEAE